MDDGAAKMIELSGSNRPRVEVLLRAAPPHVGPTLFEPAQRALSARLCVLGSGSRGNCSVLEVTFAGGVVTRVLIDLGLSPRVTARSLAQVGLDIDQTDGAVLTHLDHDHCHEGWASGGSGLPRHAEVFVLRQHLPRAQRGGLNGGRLHAFEGAFVTRHGLLVRPCTTFHDKLGCAVFRFELAGLGSVGYATDLGRATDEVLTHLKGVDVLAIESNYCPQRQAASSRPEFLKRRIMGGRGHLSNAEALEAVEAIAPRSHVVLLHLSRDCNCPELVAGLHEGSDYALTIATQHEPTRWVRFGRPEVVVPIDARPLARMLTGP